MQLSFFKSTCSVNKKSQKIVSESRIIFRSPVFWYQQIWWITKSHDTYMYDLSQLSVFYTQSGNYTLIDTK